MNNVLLTDQPLRQLPLRTALEYDYCAIMNIVRFINSSNAKQEVEKFELNTPQLKRLRIAVRFLCTRLCAYIVISSTSKTLTTVTIIR
jgi:hypothetical protein